MKKIIQQEEFDRYLKEYQGAQAQLWLFHITHKRLAIRLSKNEYSDALYIIAVDCEFISGNFSWKNAHIQVEIKAGEFKYEAEIKIFDELAKFELKCTGGYTLALGANTEMDNSFENFLGDDR